MTSLSKKGLGLTFVLSAAAMAFAQEKVEISGQIIDHQNRIVPYASVTFSNKTEILYSDAALTDENGNYVLNLVPGTYDITIEAIGYKKNVVSKEITTAQKLEDFVVENEESSTLTPTQDIEGVTIVAERKLYKVELDKKVYDMSQDPMAKGSSLSDALQNVPSVQVDSDGAVSLRGSSNVRILIDGKPSSMVGMSDPAQALQNLPADVVERIEVVTNPSARYQAEGSSGIINIILKKGKLQGFNGTVTVNGGIPKAYGASANLNYRTGKWNLFTNLGYRYAERDRISRTKTTSLENGLVTKIENSDGEAKRINDGYNFTLGTEYFLDDNNTFTISGNYRKGKNENQSATSYLEYDANNLLTGDSRREEVEKEDDYNAEINFNYKHEFEEKGHELTIDARASFEEETENGITTETGFRTDENTNAVEMVDVNERPYNFERERRVILSADYVYPFGEEGRLELGARSDMEGSLTKTFVSRLVNGSWVEKDGFTTSLDYIQNVYAAYAQYGNAFGKFSYFAGLRMESSNVIVDDILNNLNTEKNYTDWFPSLFLNYDFENNDQLQFSYSRRIRRPRGWDLNPARSNSDSRNIRQGNPDLDPQYTSAFELSYIANVGKFMLTPNIYYNYTTDNIQRYQFRELNPETNINSIISTAINIGTEQRYGMDLTFTYRPWRWWNIMGNVNVFGYKTEGSYVYDVNEPAFDFSGEGISWFGRLNNTFNLPADFNVQLSGHYRGPQETAQNERKGNYSVDFAMNKDLFNDNATLTFSIRDVLNSRAFEFSTFRDDFISENYFRWGVRTFNLAFTYRFNQKKRDRERQRQQSYDDDMGGGEM